MLRCGKCGNQVLMNEKGKYSCGRHTYPKFSKECLYNKISRLVKLIRRDQLQMMAFIVKGEYGIDPAGKSTEELLKILEKHCHGSRIKDKSLQMYRMLQEEHSMDDWIDLLVDDIILGTYSFQIKYFIGTVSKGGYTVKKSELLE